MNHVTRSHNGFVFENDVLIRQFDKILPENINLDDVLGAFYNFRNAAYGSIGKGKSYKIPTFWTQSDQPHSPHSMTAYILTDAERRVYEVVEGAGELGDSKMLVKAKVPSDLFETKNGELYYWCSEHLIPLEAIYKDFILFGDLHFKFSKGTIDPGVPRQLKVDMLTEE